MKVSKNHIYWLLQIGGWGAFGAITIVYYIISDQLQLGYFELLAILIGVVSAIGLSHIYRWVINTYYWVRLPLKLLIPRVVIAVILQGVVFLLINIGTERLLSLSEHDKELTAGIAFFSLLNTSIWFFLWSLIYFVVHFFRNYKKEEIERLKWEGAIKDFELNKLRSQLNPHFVFNALNSIRALTLTEPKKARQGITQLSNILRNSLLADRNKTIALREELITVKDYIDLEKIRFEERLHFSLQAETETENLPVPPMMIQTLVENAVKHGIGSQIEGGFIEVKTFEKSGFLIVEILNSGKIKNTTNEKEGFGIVNTKQRLHLLYGSQASFSIEQRSANIVAAYLKIPKLL